MRDFGSKYKADFRPSKKICLKIDYTVEILKKIPLKATQGTSLSEEATMNSNERKNLMFRLDNIENILAQVLKLF